MIYRGAWTIPLAVALLGLVVAVAVYWPILLATLNMFTGGFGDEVDALNDALPLLLRTTALAAAIALIASALGVFAALCLEYIRVFGRRALWFGVAMSFFMPQYVVTIAWIEMAGANGYLIRAVGLSNAAGAGAGWLYSPFGVVLIESLALYPIVAFLVAGGLRGLNTAYTDAADLHVSPLRNVIGIVLPSIRPYLVTGAYFVFLFALTSFAIPSLLQVPVYAVEVHTRFNAFYDVSGGMALGVPLALTAIAAGFALWPIGRRVGQWMPADGGNTRMRGTRRTRTVALCFCCALVGLSAGLPFIVLLVRSLPLSSYIEAWQTVRGDLMTSLVVATLSATALTLLGLGAALSADRYRKTHAFWSASIAAFLISGPALGIALIVAWNHAGPRALVYDSVAILIVACTARYFFFAYAASRVGVGMLSRRYQLDALLVAGIRPWRRLTGIVLPILAPGLVVVWGIMFLLALGEVDTSVLLSPPGFTTVPVRLFGLMHYGPSRLVAALCVLLSLAIGAAVLCGFGVAKRALGASHVTPSPR